MGDQSRLSINIYINQILSVMVSYKLDHQLTLATYLRVDNLVLLDPRLNNSHTINSLHQDILLFNVEITMTMQRFVNVKVSS